jgi:cytochrome c-type biogenesis protein
MGDITIFFAFVAGLLSFFSPCIFPLIPAYISHLTGSRIEDNKINIEKRILISRSIAFILGFSMIFVIMGASASLLGQLFMENRQVIEKISGILIIIFGLQMAGIIHIRFLMYQKQRESDRQSKSVLSSLILGFAFGTGWTPCVGLALSSILLLASSSDTLYNGMYLLWFYSLGLGIPFFLMALAITYSLGIIKKINRYLPTLSLINGWIMILLGILLFTGQMLKISAWLAKFTYFTY